MEPLVTFHILPLPTWNKVEIVVWERGVGEPGQFDLSTTTWERIRPCIVPGPGFRIRLHRP